MRVFIAVVLLILSLQSWTKADDIRDFEIEGMSIGDSLLNYFSEEEINKNLKYYYKNKTYTPVEIKSNSYKNYDKMSFSYKTDNNNYIIESIAGMILFNNDMKECENTKKNILKEIQKILIGNKFSHHEGKLDSDPLGKYIMDGFFFDNGDSIDVTCYDYSEKSGYQDVLSITFTTKEFQDFLGYAYD